MNNWDQIETGKSGRFALFSWPRRISVITVEFCGLVKNCTILVDVRDDLLHIWYDLPGTPSSKNSKTLE